MPPKTAEQARAEVHTALRACIAQTVSMFAVLYWVVTPAVERWRWLVAPAALVVLGAVWWSWRYASRWKRHLQWCELKSRTEEAGDTITMLGLLASPDSDRPLMWPAFWFRWWGIKP